MCAKKSPPAAPFYVTLCYDSLRMRPKVKTFYKSDGSSTCGPFGEKERRRVNAFNSSAWLGSREESSQRRRRTPRRPGPSHHAGESNVAGTHPERRATQIHMHRTIREIHENDNNCDGSLLEHLPEHTDFDNLVKKASDRRSWNKFVRQLDDSSALPRGIE